MNSEIELRPDTEHVKFKVSRQKYLSCLLEIELIKIILQIVILISLKEILNYKHVFLIHNSLHIKQIIVWLSSILMSRMQKFIPKTCKHIVQNTEKIIVSGRLTQC